MLRLSCITTLLLGSVLAIQAGSTAFAQDASRYESYFRELDRDNNGELSAEEFQRIRESSRDRLLQMGIAANRPIKKAEFLTGMAGADEIRQKEQELERQRTGDTSSGGDSRGGSSGGGGGDSRGRSSRGKPRVVATLPPAFQALDKNFDGQIALYEWDRTKITEFRQLDRNGDSFLTAQELINPGPLTVAIVPQPPSTTNGTAVAKPGSPGNSPIRGAPGSSRSGSSTPSSPPTPASTEDPLVRQAKVFYGYVDKDKDGQISEEEWKASRGVRKLFEDAKIEPTLPMSADTFNENFVKIKQTEK